MHCPRSANKARPRPRSLERSSDTPARSAGKCVATRRTARAGCTGRPWPMTTPGGGAPALDATDALLPRTGPRSWRISGWGGALNRSPDGSEEPEASTSATRPSTATSGPTSDAAGRTTSSSVRPERSAASVTAPTDSRGRLAGKRHISERPAAVEARTELGHWEIDTMLGKGRPCVVTLVERSAGYVMIGQLKARTVTDLNNGTEFHGYKQIEEEDRRPILLRHAPPLPGARHLGEHQRPRQAVPAQGTEHAPAHPGRLRPHRPTTQHPPQVAPPLPHTQGGNMIAHASMKRCTSKLIPRRMPFSPGTPLDRSMEVL